MRVRLGGQQKLTKVDLEDAGDGTVPTWSSGLGSGVQSQPVGGEHATIYKNDALRRTLARLLGYAGVLAAAAPDRVEVAIPERVIEPDELVHVALTFPAGVNKVEGQISLQRATLSDVGEVTGYTAYGKGYPIAYEGMNAEKLNVSFDAPENRGIYKVQFESSQGEKLGEDDLFVQEPGPPGTD